MDGRRRIVCVIVGDGAVGKTCMLVSYTQGRFPETYVPTIFDNWSTEIMVGTQQIRYELRDTAGQEDFDRIRILSYDGADVIICCYAVDSRTSLQNVRTKWFPEFRMHCPNAPFILCGTKADMRNDPYARNLVDPSEVKSLAKELKAKHSVECSALTGKYLKEVFDQSILAVMPRAICCTLL